MPLNIESEVKVKVKSLSRVRLFVTPWTVAHQAPPSMGFSKQEYWSGLPFLSSSMGFSRQEYWSGLPFPSPGDLPNPGIEPGSPAFQADVLTSEPPGKPSIEDNYRRVSISQPLGSQSASSDLNLANQLVHPRPEQMML